jgi:hypothetical protein
LGGLLTAFTAIQFRVEPGTTLCETSSRKRLTSADSGLQLDLEIALGGFPAEVQPHGYFQPSRRYVETSGDVIEDAFTKSKNNCRALFSRDHCRTMPYMIGMLSCRRLRINRRWKLKRDLHFVTVEIFEEQIGLAPTEPAFVSKLFRQLQFNSKVDRPLRRAMLMIAASPPNFSIELATGRVRPSADKPPSPGLRRAGGTARSTYYLWPFAWVEREVFVARRAEGVSRCTSQAPRSISEAFRRLSQSFP